MVEAEDDQAADGDRTDRDKRKIGVVKLGLSNGIINFVFNVRWNLPLNVPVRMTLPTNASVGITFNTRIPF